LPHFTTAELVKSRGAGVGRTGGLKATGELVKYSFASGRLVWTLRVDDWEFNVAAP
jgi:hypothetical protein